MISRAAPLNGPPFPFSSSSVEPRCLPVNGSSALEVNLVLLSLLSTPYQSLKGPRVLLGGACLSLFRLLLSHADQAEETSTLWVVHIVTDLTPYTSSYITTSEREEGAAAARRPRATKQQQESCCPDPTVKPPVQAKGLLDTSSSSHIAHTP
jgi:hypothetical protein